MKIVKYFAAISAITVLIAAMAGCSSHTADTTQVSNKPLPPPSAQVLQQRANAANQAFNNAMSGPNHPPASSPAAMAAFQNGMRNAYAANPPAQGGTGTAQ